MDSLFVIYQELVVFISFGMNKFLLVDRLIDWLQQLRNFLQKGHISFNVCFLNACMYMYRHIWIYFYICIFMSLHILCIYTYIYIYLQTVSTLNSGLLEYYIWGVYLTAKGLLIWSVFYVYCSCIVFFYIAYYLFTFSENHFLNTWN